MKCSPCRLVALGVVSLALSLAAASARPACAQGRWAPAYPVTRRGNQSDDVGGIRVADPFRWLEDVGSPDVRSWVTAQNAVTRGLLDQLPRRAEVARVAALSAAYTRWSVPAFGGDRVFYAQADAQSNQPVLWVQDRRDMPPHVLIDPNAFSGEGLIAIVDQIPSPDGRYLAYAVSTQGSSWRAIRIREMRTNQDLPEEVDGLWAGSRVAWTADGRGFVYVRSDLGRPSGTSASLAPLVRQQVCYHRVGTPQSSDRVVFERPGHPDWRYHADVSDDGQYLVITARVRTAVPSRMYLIDLDNPTHPNFGAPLVTLFDAADAAYDFVANEGPIFFVRTTKNAPRGRVIAVDINQPGEEHWTTVVRETYDPLVGAVRVDDRLVANRVHDAHSTLELYALDGVARGAIALPGAGTASQLVAHGRELYFDYSSFLQPHIVFRYDLDGRAVTAYREPAPDSTLSTFETTQLFFASGDGARIPMYVTAKRGITLDGSHPALLAARGAFGDPATPAFSPFVLAWLRLGGIYAVANVRGGGEYGRLWHEAAMSAHKSVSIDDFAAAAEFLVDQRYTRSPLLGAVGRGAGGLLAAAAAVRRPDLFGAAAIDDALLDMARFDRFAAPADWTTEFGSPIAPGDLRALLAYSPLSNVRMGTVYPPILVSAGMHDDYVTPANSFKFTAALQTSEPPGNLALLRGDDEMGHGPGIPHTRQVALDTDRLLFLTSMLHASQ